MRSGGVLCQGKLKLAYGPVHHEYIKITSKGMDMMGLRSANWLIAFGWFFEKNKVKHQKLIHDQRIFCRLITFFRSQAKEKNGDISKEAAFLVRIFHVSLWTCSKLEHWCS